MTVDGWMIVAWPKLCPFHPIATNATQVMDALAEAGEREEALALLRGMKGPGGSCKPDKRTYTAAIKAMIKAADVVEGRSLFEEMLEARIVPDAVTYCTLMELYGAAGHKEQVRASVGRERCMVQG